MAAGAKTSGAAALAGARIGWAASARAPRALLVAAFEREWAERRFFLWLPVAAGAGVALYFAADTEPNLAYAFAVLALCLAACLVCRRMRGPLIVAAGGTALVLGFTAATLRTAWHTHAMIDRVQIRKLAGIIEEVDHRRVGARFVLRVTGGEGAEGGDLGRIRVTTRRGDPIEAGNAVRVTVRLVPPASAAMPGSYSFARDAYFAGYDAVGSVLGRIVADPAPALPDAALRFKAAVDRARNALALRVSTILPGDTGAIGAAMVTGKRDLLSDDGRELIREAGIFHIITIAGVQMTLVAGLLFAGFRSALAAVPAVALRYPIKAWAAVGAMLGAVLYDCLTGSRIGTQRALFMTLIMLGAVVLDRRAFTMRNLALAALTVVVFEPEAVLGASFQLSFAAVAALVAVQEANLGARLHGRPAGRATRGDLGLAGRAVDRVFAAAGGATRLLVATVAATSATAPVMASNFHEISPYVVIGNPLTLAIIEFFAVPGALLGSVLYPLGLDRFVWHWVGWGIEIVLWAARHIAATPGATLTVPAFASWSLPCFALATCSAVIWRSPVLRATAVPFFLAGLAGTQFGARYDLIVAPQGDTVAYRDEDGRLAVAGRSNGFGTLQWLTADGDARPAAALAATRPASLRCDGSACVAILPQGRTLSLVARRDAFAEDCRRADVIVTPLYAPESCAAEVIVDRGTLAETGALGFNLRNGAFVAEPARAAGEDRPWSRPPRTPPQRRASVMPPPAGPDDDEGSTPVDQQPPE